MIQSKDSKKRNHSKKKKYQIQKLQNSICSVSSVNCHTSGISKYAESLLVTHNVKSLYASIPNNGGIKAVREAYDKHPSKSVSTKVIITFLSLILTLNKFIFNCSHYLQVTGCAMGTICAPTYANIFMAQYEAKHIYPYIHGKVLLFLR